jgi:hypothetical protein
LQEKLARFNNIAELCIVKKEIIFLDNSKNNLKYYFQIFEFLSTHLLKK